MPGNLDPTTADLFEILIVLALTLLMGLEREAKSAADRSYVIAGVRTFPLIGLTGYVVARLSPGSPIPLAMGLLAITPFLAISYAHKLRSGDHGVTTEVSVLVAFLVGALVERDMVRVAMPVAVAAVLLLQAKAPMERFATRLPMGEITTCVKFLLLAGVILPVLPNQSYTQFGLNPFKTWLVVVVVSGISYVSYIIQRLARSRNSVLLTALLGGAYSSTLTTVVLAKRARLSEDRRLYAGATLLASSVMYLRLAILLWAFNSSLGWALGPRFVALGLVAGGVAWAVTSLGRKPEPVAAEEPEMETKNPLELHTAFIFAGLFVAISVVTQLVTRSMGQSGLFALAGVMGIADVDPFIMSLTQTAGAATPLQAAAVAVVIAAASNNIAKGIYATALGGKRTGLLAAGLLWGLAAAGLVVLVGM